MSGAKVINSLLKGAAPVTSLVATRIYPQELPLDSAIPALAFSTISSLEQPTMCASGPYALMAERVQIDVFAASYDQLKSLMGAVKAAVRYARGTIAGVSVQTIDSGMEYSDGRDTARGICVQSVDFTVLYSEARS